MNTFSGSECIRFGWETFKKRPWFLIGAFLLTVLISGVVSGIVSSLFPGTKDSPSLIGVLVNFVVNTFVGIGMTSLALRAHESVETARVADLWRPQFFLYYLCTSVLLFLATAIGFILLIIPGVMAMLAFYFSNYVVVDRGLGPIASMKESARITRGHRWQLLGFLLLLALLNILGAILLLIGLLVTIPVTMLAIVHAYRTLEQSASAMTPAM